MKPLDLARRYMDIVFGGGDVAELTQILGRRFHFHGPFHQFNSAEDYIESLGNDPPEGFSYEVIDSFESATAACLIYRFSKPGIDLPMAQLFQIEDDRIGEILLVFDTAAFSE